jgi:hypothetical protein
MTLRIASGAALRTRRVTHLGPFVVLIAAACSATDDTSNGGGSGGFVGGSGGAISATGGAPVASPACGNGMLDPTEQCDDALVPTCAEARMNANATGTVRCTQYCLVDMSQCSAPPAGAGGIVGMGAMTGAGGTPNGTGGVQNTGGIQNTGGAAIGTGGTVGGDDFEALRQACVDTINAYRATLGLAALARASADLELCSDDGAELDATTGQAHGSAGDCGGLGGQNTCPGWNPNFYGGEVNALNACLEMMWDEGEPPMPRNQCVQPANYQTCFLVHGHYMNMSDPGYSVVACGFYRMPNGEIWMNQNFGG